jgi:Tfp pilus assembly protein PilX
MAATERPQRRHPSGSPGPRVGGRLVEDERGVALVMTLIILLILSGLVLALLSASGFEPQISRNHGHTVRARYVAEAGIEYAYDRLATTPDAWDDFLVGATCALGAILGAPTSNLPGLGNAHGIFTVRVRNDCDTNDDKRTGVSLDTTGGPCGADAGSPTHDANCRVIVTSTGTIGTTTRTISVVVSKTAFPALTGAVAFPGIQANVDFSSSTIVIDGRDARLSDSPGAPTGPAPAVYGIAVNGGLPTLAAQLKTALANSPQNDVRGKDETNVSATTKGPDTMQSDDALTSQAVSDLVAWLRSSADVAVDSAPGDIYSVSNIGAACSSDLKSSMCWGTTAHPKTVYVRGTPPVGGAPPPTLNVTGDSGGTGILIVENGTVEIGGNFRWNGPIIVTGRGAAIRYRGDGNQSVYGGVVVNDSDNSGATNLAGKASILYSKEALDLVQHSLRRRLVSTHGWIDR